MSYPTEVRKENNVLLIDFGTQYAKISVMKDGALIEDILLLPNRIYHISEERAKALATEQKGEITIPTGLFTQKEIEDAKLLFQAEEAFVMSDATPDNLDLVTKGYQNICEQIDKQLSYSGADAIAGNYTNWAVMIAVAAFETAEGRKQVEDFHVKATKKMNFKAIYINNQLMFDYFSQINYLEQIGAKAGYCMVIDIGGGDTKVGGVSGLPIQESFRRFNIGGQEITRYCQNVLRERYNVTGTAYETIENWLIEGGTVEGNAPDTEKDFKRKKVNVKDILNTPEMLFDYNKYYKKDRRFNSITEILIQSVEAVIEKSEAGIELLLGAVIVVGGASRFNGLTQRLNRELSSYFNEFKDQINVIVGEDPQNACINGMRALIAQKYKAQNPGLAYIDLQAMDEDEE
ncbi:MAG: rod shape-determining protein [Candidatus Hodarchaeales archaeon]|jgi:actin-like ATPase involved in cell morphogenesis